MTSTAERGYSCAEDVPCVSAAPAGFSFGWRHISCLLIWAISIICYADRTNIGIVVGDTGFEGVPADDKGIIFSAFFIGYFCTQILGGYLARRIGSKPTLLIAAATWTIFDVLTPFAANLGLTWLVLDRIGMGLGEGMLYPAQHAYTAFWVPSHERALSIAFMTSGQDMGATIANIVSPQLLKAGSLHVFVFWGFFAVLWCVVFVKYGASAPEVHARCKSSGEAAWIQRCRRGVPDFNSRQTVESPVPLRLLKEPCIWAIFAGHTGMNYCWYVMLSWLPTFFKHTFNIKLADHPIMLASPYLASLAGILTGGMLSDKLVRNGFRTRGVRKVMQVTGAVLNLLALQLAVRSSNPNSAALWIAFAAFFGKFQTSGFWVNMVDVCPETAGTVMGLSNTIATIPGIIGQGITQSMLSAFGGESSVPAWAAVFGIGGIIAIAGAVLFATFGDDVSLDHRNDDAPHDLRDGQERSGEPFRSPDGNG